jgi:hypothetical protein
VVERVDAALTALDALGLPASVVGVVRSATSSAVDRITALIAVRHRVLPPSGGTVRHRYRIVGIAGATALVATIVAASLPSRDQGEAVPEPAVATSATPGPAGANDNGALAVVGLPETELYPEPDVWRGIVDELVGRWLACGPAAGADDEGASPDEPLVAAPACQAGVVHAGSSASRLIAVADDRHRLLQEWSGLRGEIVVVERMGSAVLIDLLAAETTTASLLVVRSEAGWRIRDVIG